MFKRNKSSSNGYFRFITFFMMVCFFACHPAQKTKTRNPESFISEPKIPPGYTKIIPRAVEDSKDMLSQTATIFQGQLKRIYFTYDECAGPRTNYIFSQTKTLIGSNVDSEVNLKTFGGPLPTGTWLNISELPQLAYNASYLIFLRNTDWTFSPVVGDLIFRHEVENGKEILVDPTGHFVKGWNENGPVLSTATVSDPVGFRLYGSKGRDTSFSDNPNRFQNDDTVVSRVFKVSRVQLDSSKRVKANPSPNSDVSNIHLPAM